MKVLVLGHTGMLGNAVCNYLHELNDVSFVIIKHRWPTDSFKNDVKKFDGDYIINCIGITKHNDEIKDFNKTIKINSILPHQIDNLIRKKVYSNIILAYLRQITLVITIGCGHIIST